MRSKYIAYWRVSFVARGHGESPLGGIAVSRTAAQQ
jgi:hypothetical protein